MSFFIADALAQTTSSAQTAGNSGFASIIMLVGFVVIFYFLLLRPQAKRAKEHRALISNLAKGDEVITSGGLMGKISQINEDFVGLQIADNVEIKVQKGAVTTVLPKGTLK